MRPASYLLCMQCNADLTKEGKKRRRCAGCHSVFYDDVACQKKDWAIHKTECKELQRRFIAAVRPHLPEVDTMAKLLPHPDACGVIAQCFFHGQGGFEKNLGLAIFWATRWVKGGDVMPMYMLGICYTGELVPHKYKEGVKLLLRACGDSTLKKDLGRLVLGQCQLAWCYRSGKGVQVNQREAMKWCRLAAEGGHANAQALLGEMTELGEGVEKDEEEGMVWYRKAAEQGNAEGQMKVGMHFLKLPVEKAADETPNEIIGLKWIRKSAEQGNATAECVLGSFLARVAEDPTEAVVWYRKSADQGNALAQYELGECYYHGLGVAVDHEEAIRLFRLAAERGHARAKAALLKLEG